MEYVLKDLEEAREAGWLKNTCWENEESYDYPTLLFKVDGDKVTFIASDIGEPEDNTFGRDWSWVPEELNKLAKRLLDTKRELERWKCGTQVVSDGRTRTEAQVLGMEDGVEHEEIE